VRRALILSAALLALAPGCGFQKTEPVSNVCTLLSLADVQSLAPGLTTATEQPPKSSQDVWTRSCRFSASNGMVHVDLVVSGALTASGDQQLADNVSGAPIPEVEVTVVNGLGDRAVYTNNVFYGSGLTAKQGGYEVGVGTVISSSISELDLLVRSVLGRLPER